MINDGVSNLCVVPSCFYFGHTASSTAKAMTTTTVAAAATAVVASVAIFAVWRKIKSGSLILKATYSHFSSARWGIFLSFSIRCAATAACRCCLPLLFYPFFAWAECTTQRLRFMTYTSIRTLMRSEIIPHDMDCFKLNAQIVYKQFFSMCIWLARSSTILVASVSSAGHIHVTHVTHAMECECESKIENSA